MLNAFKNIINTVFFRPTFAAEKRALNKVFTSPRFAGEEVQLLGSAYGGWYLPRSFAPSATDVLYCIGAGEDISFDCALAKNYPCTVCIFDPTPKAFKHYTRVAEQLQGKAPLANNSSICYDIGADDFKKITFCPVGVSHTSGAYKFYFPENPDHVSCSTENIQNTKSYFQAECYAMSDLLVKNKHNIPYLLKMDIEGAEYAVLKNMVVDNIIPKFLAVEFHFTPSANSKNIFYDTLILLKNAGMNCIHLNWPDVVFMREN